MYETTYHRASSVDEAAALFAKGIEAKYLAGGQTLLPVMKQRLASPSDVIDLAKIKDLVGVLPTNNGIEIKAATTHYDVASSDAVKKALPALAHLASMIGAGAECDRQDQQARHCGGRFLQGTVLDRA
jgi:aerobic carbon-monoxide dehydrogenase medium subunit